MALRHRPGPISPLLTSPVFVEQIRHHQDALRLAGERECPRTVHCTARMPATRQCKCRARRRSLPRTSFACSPKHARSSSNTAARSWGRSIPGAVGLKFGRSGWQLQRCGAESPARQDAHAGRGRSRQAVRRGRLERGTRRRSQPGAAPRGAGLHAGVPVLWRVAKPGR